jgi:hypothetical protein
MAKTNRYLEAFKESYNAVGIASAVALSAALLTPIPLIAGIVAEAAYLLFVPDSRWYTTRLSKRFDAEVEQRRQNLINQTLPLLRPEMQERYRRLEEMRRQIDTESQSDKTWFREVLRKLDYLLEKFLLFAAKEVEFRRYVQSLADELDGDRNQYDLPGPLPTADQRRESRRNRDRTVDDIPRRKMKFGEPRSWQDPPVSAEQDVQRLVDRVNAHYQDERETVERSLAAEQDADTQAVLRKRLDVLARRQEFAGKIGKILSNLNHQLQLVQDTFGLINDEIRARSPEQILSDIDEVVMATDSMSSALEELAPYEQMVARMSS